MGLLGRLVMNDCQEYRFQRASIPAIPAPVTGNGIVTQGPLLAGVPRLNVHP
jgi:hypothetical protein